MRLLKTAGGKRVFHLGKKEMALLRALLQRYPLVPPAHQPLSKSAAAGKEADQILLDEALAEQQQENKRQLLALLKNRRRCRQSETGWRLTLTDPEMEWLLQVLNDIRVGSWIRLGSPEKNMYDFDLNPATVPHAWALEMAGYFQMHLLEALRQEGAT